MLTKEIIIIILIIILVILIIKIRKNCIFEKFEVTTTSYKSIIDTELTNINNKFNNKIYAPYKTDTKVGLYYDLKLNRSFTYWFYFKADTIYIYDNSRLLKRTDVKEKDYPLVYRGAGISMNRFYRFVKEKNNFFVQREFFGYYPITFIQSNIKLNITENLNNINNEFIILKRNLLNNFNKDIVNRYTFRPKIDFTNYFIIFELFDTTFNMDNFIIRLNSKINDINDIQNLYINTDINSIFYNKGILAAIFFNHTINIINDNTIEYTLNFYSEYNVIFDFPEGKYFGASYIYNMLVDIKPINYIDSNNNLSIKYLNTSELFNTYTMKSGKLFQINEYEDLLDKTKRNKNYKIINENNRYYFIRTLDSYISKSDITDYINEYIDNLNKLSPISNAMTKLKISENSIKYTITIEQVTL